MSNTFNLNIMDYDINELKDLLNLRDPYTLEDIVKNEDELREKLLLDSAVSRHKKKEIIVFLESAKELLIQKAKEAFKKENSVALECVRKEVEKTTINKLLCVDSRFRDDYNTTLSTKYTVTLPTIIKDVVSMELTALEIPDSYYQISKSKGNNFFWIKTNESNKSLWYYISIPDGSYLRQQMQQTINVQLNIAFSSSPLVKIGMTTIKTTFSLINKKLSFELYFNMDNGGHIATRKGPCVQPGLKEQGYKGNFGWLMGYRKESYTNSTEYISEGSYDALGTKYFYIIVNDFNKNVNNFCIPNNESLGITNILARISRISRINDNYIRPRFYSDPVNISKLELQVVDELGITIDLNNMDFSMALNLNCLYNPSTFIF